MDNPRILPRSGIRLGKGMNEIITFSRMDKLETHHFRVNKQIVGWKKHPFHLRQVPSNFGFRFHPQRFHKGRTESDMGSHPQNAAGSSSPDMKHTLRIGNPKLKLPEPCLGQLWGIWKYICMIFQYMYEIHVNIIIIYVYIYIYNGIHMMYIYIYLYLIFETKPKLPFQKT